MPVPADNPLSAEKVKLGRRLFSDRRLSRDGKVACVTCHDPKKAFSDGRKFARGVLGREGTRNAPAILNRGYGERFFWDGRTTTLERQVLEPIVNPKEMDISLEMAEGRMHLTRQEIAQALASFVRSIGAGWSPFDYYSGGKRDALSAREMRGLELFRGKANCVACHVGPNFTDEQMHNTGVAFQGGRLTDPGGGNGKFKTPTLREVARTAPYMHDGSIATLKDVIEFYDKGGNRNQDLDPELRPLRLSAPEKSDLLSFLHALSGRIVEGRTWFDKRRE